MLSSFSFLSSLLSQERKCLDWRWAAAATTATTITVTASRRPVSARFRRVAACLDLPTSVSAGAAAASRAAAVPAAAFPVAVPPPASSSPRPPCNPPSKRPRKMINQGTVGQSRKKHRINSHLINHCPASEGVSERVSAAEWATECSGCAKRVVWSKQTSEPCERTSEVTSEWPSTSVCIIG